MSAIPLIAACLPQVEPPELAEDGVCCVTGLRGPTIPRSWVIKPTFTNLDLLRAPESDRASVDAWHVMNHDACRKSLWFCDGKEFRTLKRVDVRPMVLAGVPARKWCGYVTTSYKKHGALRAPINSGRSRVWLFETLLVDCSDSTTVSQHWKRMRDAQDAGIHRPLIESLDIGPAYMAKVGWRLWRDFEVWARPRVKSPLYQFIAYLLPSKAEIDG